MHSGVTLARRDFWDTSDPPKPKAGTLKVLGLLRSALDRSPAHPLAAHILIHATEAAFPGPSGAGEAQAGSCMHTNTHTRTHTHSYTFKCIQGEVQAGSCAHASTNTFVCKHLSLEGKKAYAHMLTHMQMHANTCTHTCAHSKHFATRKPYMQNMKTCRRVRRCAEGCVCLLSAPWKMQVAGHCMIRWALHDTLGTT